MSTMNEIENNIRKYGQKREEDNLKSYVATVRQDELVELLENRLNNANFVYVWDYIMQSFDDSASSHQKRLGLALALLHKLEETGVSSSHHNALVARLCIEFPKFRPQNLITLCEFCLERIQKGRITGMCWKEVLPEALNVLVETPMVHHNDSDKTGLAYKNEFVNSLCVLVWSPSIITSLASMFLDMPLTKEEHYQVVNRLGQHMEKLTCQEVPAFVYQLLILCHSQNSRSIFLRLQYYFGTRIYSNANQFSDSDTANLDTIGSASDQEVMEVESTVLYHIYQSASLGHDSIKDYLTSLKNMMKSPEFVLHPFHLTVLLMISTIQPCEERVMEILKSCISRSIHEEQKMQESTWFKEMVPRGSNVEEVLLQIINCSLSNNRPLVIQGLVLLANILLGVGSALGRDGDLIAEKQWDIGKMIILRVIKKKRQISPVIITSLSNRIATGQNVYQYIECINVLCQKMSLIMLENQSCVIEMVEYLVQVPGLVANRLLNAILPLIKLSPTIRDHLILLLRKSLYSRVIETRQMAVSGFLKLIQSLKISNLAALSQSSTSSSSSGHSLLTQASLNCTGRNTASVFSNEALCLEVLGILRRCFMQQAEVRTQLYEGLYDAVCMNPELGVPVLDVIWLHFSTLYVPEEDSLPPLRYSKISTIKDMDVILQEPLGKLIYSTGLILTKVKETDDTNPTVLKFSNALESLCVRMVNCELIHFELDDGTDLNDIVPEAHQKLLVLKESISVYEALIGYKICSWGPQSEKNAQQISNLFQGYNRLLDFSKNLLKPKKGKKKLDDMDKTTQQTQSTTKKEKDKKGFKLPNTVLDFQTVGKILHLLHKTSVSWSSTLQANIIKSKPEIHRHMVQAAISLVQKLKKRRTAELQQSKLHFNYMVEIAGILYERCITRLDEFIDFDSATAILVLECFHLILVVVSTHYRSQLPLFLSSVGGKNKDDEFIIVLESFIKTYESLLEIDETDTNTDQELKKLSAIAITTLNLFASHIPIGPSTLSLQFLDWLKKIVNDIGHPNKQIISNIISLAFNTHIKFKSSVAFFEAVALRLGVIFGTVNEEKLDVEEPKIIDESTAIIIFPILCNSLKSMLDDIDWVILRLRAEYGMISYPGEDNPERRREYLKIKERGVCCHLCSIITIFGIICNVTVPAGNLSEALMKIISHLYSSLSNLTKYLMLRSNKHNLAFQGARFESVVKLAGKQLSNIVYDFIIYLEEAQKQDAESSQRKRKNVDSSTMKSRVLKQTRLIPKVVYDIEQFGKFVIQLSNKTKVDLSKFIGQGTARDFRIKGLKEVLEQSGNDLNTSMEEDDSNVREDDVTSDQVSDADDAGPPKKKIRV